MVFTQRVQSSSRGVGEGNEGAAEWLPEAQSILDVLFDANMCHTKTEDVQLYMILLRLNIQRMIREACLPIYFLGDKFKK